MLGTGDVDERTGKEPLLANETVPSEFLPSDTSKPTSRRFTVVLAVTVGVMMTAAIGLGFAQEDPVWPEDLLPLVEFVEEQRGLEFVRPVLITEDEEDRQRPLSDNDRWTRSIRCQFEPGLCPESEAFRLLGVNAFDPAAYIDLDEFFAVRGNPSDTPRLPGAFYQTGDVPKIVLENSASLPDGLRDAIIVHELVHALQDQHALLGNGGDPASARGQIDLSVVEGDATRIESAYIEQLDPASRASVESAEREVARASAEADAATPLRHYSDTTYALGQAFSSLLVARDGQAGLDDLLRDPTLSSDDVFVDILGENIEASIDASQLIDLPESVDEPDGRVGAIGWFVTLAPLVGADQAFDAVIGYDDDAWVIYDNPNVQRTSPLRTCIRSDIFFDTANDAAEFANIAELPQVELALDEQRRSVTLDICDELRDAELQTPAVMIPIITANHLAAQHLENGEPSNVARCAALAQAKTIPIDLTFDEFRGYDTFAPEAGPFLEACQ